MEDCFVHLSAEDLLGKFDSTNFLTRHIYDFHIRHCVFLLPLCFNRITNEYDAALCAGNCTLHCDKILFCVDLNRFKVKDGNLLVTPLSSHLLVLEDSSRVDNTHGTGLTMYRAYAVCHSELVEIPSLDSAGVSVTLGNTCDIDLLALGEGIDGYYRANFKCGAIVKAEFLEMTLRCNACLLKVTKLCLVRILLYILVCELYSVVAVVLDGLLLCYHARTCFNQGYGYYVAFGIEDLGHTQLSADNAFFHVFLHSYWLTVLILPFGIRQHDF